MAELAQTYRGPVEDLSENSGDDTDAFLKRCVKLFNRAETAEQQNRQNAVDDLRFKSGDQWPENIKAARTLDQRPCLTINKVKTFVHQITNDQRQNRPAINVSPIGDKSDPETAKMLKGLIRQIERQSNADVAYDTAFDGAVSNGWGYWRLITDYESEDSFDQVIRIQRIRNPFRVYIDPDAEEPDGSDAQWCFISDLLTREDFKQEYPDADEMAWTEGTIGDEYKTWATQTHIRIAEYFYFEAETKTLVALSTGQSGFDDDPDIKAIIDLYPDLVVNEREVHAKRVKWCKLTAHEILEENDWPGKWIPVVKVIGDEIDVEGQVTLAGIVRDIKDPQRMYNYWRTHQTELIALQPKAPFIMEEGQVEGHEQRWKSANTKSLPYLLYKGTNVAGKPAPPPQRQPMPAIPLGVTQATLDSAQDMQAASGIRFDATLNERMHNESGKALRELKRVGDLGSFHYIDNLARSLKHTGRILIDLIPKIYDTRRVLTILREDDSEQTVILDPALQQSSAKQQMEDGKVQRLYNPKLGEYEVAVTIGPSFATKRQEASEGMLSFMQTIPNSAPLVADLIAKNQDWPGAEDIAARLASQLPPSVQDKSIEDMPPEAKGIIGSMKQQLQQLKQERDRAVAMLGDKGKDRAVDQDKVNKDFEAKMTAIAADMEQAKMDMIQARDEMLNKPGADNESAMQKINADFEAKIMKIIADLEVARMKNQTTESVASMKDDGSRRREDMVKTEATAKDLMRSMGAVLETISRPKKRRMTKIKDGVYEAEEILQ